MPCLAPGSVIARGAQLHVQYSPGERELSEFSSAAFAVRNMPLSCSLPGPLANVAGENLNASFVNRPHRIGVADHEGHHKLPSI